MINREFWDVERDEEYWDQSDLFYWMSRRAPSPNTVTALYESAYEMLATQGMGTGDEPEVMRGPRPEDLLELYPEDLDVLA